MYTLFVLGELMDRPMHGYLLHSILSRMLGPIRQVSWGTMYPILRRMEEDGFIQQVTDGNTGGQGRPRKVYAITPLGESEFHRLMQRPLEHSEETEDLFRVKLTKFLHISSDAQVEIIRQYRTFLEVYAGGIAEQTNQVREKQSISDVERPHILNAIDYEMAITQAKLAWVDTHMTIIKSKQ